jgi:2,3-bisphosphoglycerate-independent phosphoglycerate mutase
VLDGFGIGSGDAGDAIARASTPFLDRLDVECPRASLATSGRAVGLPDGQMGNSEVGHMTLGAGRVILQDLVLIQDELDAGRVAEMPAMRELLATGQRAGSRVHLIGLVSDGGVHSSFEHLMALLDIVANRGLRPVVHAFTDGRDTAPSSALTWIEPLERAVVARGGAIATVAGRYFGMDRDHRWDRTARAYAALVTGTGERAATAVQAVLQAYERKEGDEFIQPTVVGSEPRLRSGDAVLMFNFRADRARQLAHALTRPKPDLLCDEIAALPAVELGCLVTMTRYDDALCAPVLFPRRDVRHTVGEIVASARLRQLRIAETEKYAHVTYFFNAGAETPFEGEDRIMIPSPRDVPTYDRKPEMSAIEVTDALVGAIDAASPPLAFVLVNYANPDMVGHTGVMDASIRAVETVDACLARLCDCVLAHSGTLLITADHGNIEQLIDPETGGPHTAHTTNPVPIWWVTRAPGAALRDGGLADVAPTLCELLAMPVPEEMTGQSLIASGGASREAR